MVEAVTTQQTPMRNDILWIMQILSFIHHDIGDTSFNVAIVSIFVSTIHRCPQYRQLPTAASGSHVASNDTHRDLQIHLKDCQSQAVKARLVGPIGHF